jgi:cytochrome bd-type quinol oxidase subunit 1
MRIKKSNYYFTIWQVSSGILMMSSVLIAKYPLVFFLSTIIGIIGAQQLITYKKLWVIENKISTQDVGSMIKKTKIIVIVIQVCIIITAILIASQTFHKIKF